MLSVISLFSIWDWLQVLGTVMVLVGVIGELVAEFKKFPFNPTGFPPLESLKKRIEITSLVVLILGLLLEVVSLPHSVVEAANARKMAGEANKLASGNELAAKQLEIQLNETSNELANTEIRLIEVRNENLPIDIGDQYSLAEALKPLSGMQVELRSAVDSKAQQTADWLASTFSLAGWPVINRTFIGDIGEEGVVVGDNGSEPAKTAAHLLLKLLTERKVPSKAIDDPTGFRVRGVGTNSIIVAILQRPKKLEADLMLVLAKQTELSDQEPKISARIFELSTNRYITGSKELAAARAEYDELNSQFLKLQNEQNDLDEQEQKLSAQMDKEDAETNSLTPGIHMFNSTIQSGIPLSRFISISGTNATILLNKVNFNPPPLQ